jgi:hypothetical protein
MHSTVSWPAKQTSYFIPLPWAHRILFFSFFFSRYEQLITICGHHHHRECHPCSTLDMDIPFLIHNTRIMVSPLDCLNYPKPNLGLSRVVLDMYISRGLIINVLKALWLYIWKSPLPNGCEVFCYLSVSLHFGTNSYTLSYLYTNGQHIEYSFCRTHMRVNIYFKSTFTSVL